MLSVEAKKKAEEEYDAKWDSYASYVGSCRGIMDHIFEWYLKLGFLDIIHYGIALFDKSSTRTDILLGMEQDVYMLHRTIARLINERTGVEHFYYVKEEDRKRFEPICRNIMRGNFKGEEHPDLEQQQTHNILLMNPYEFRMYCYIMRENDGITDELRAIMEYLCVDKMALANSYLEDKYSLADYNTYEAIIEFEKASRNWNWMNYRKI